VRGQGAGIAIAAVLIALGLVAAAPAHGAPREGRWVANGDGVRIAFVVTRANRRLIATHPVAFCGDYGEPVGGEDFRRRNAGDVGHWFDAGYALVARGGRLRSQGAPISGRLLRTRGRLTWNTKRALDVPPPVGGGSCPASAYRQLRARRVGPVRIRDGLWHLAGTLGSEGWLEVYGGGSLVRFGGTFVGPPSPQVPEAGPCLVNAGGSAAGAFGHAVPAPIHGAAFTGGATVDIVGIVDTIAFIGAFTAADWAYGTFDGLFNYAGQYTCGAAGFWLARHKRGPRYFPEPRGRGPRPPRPGPAPPGDQWPAPPPAGDNDFRCTQGSEDDEPAASELCKTYVRSASESITLLWGNRQYGFRHIRRRHGFSTKADALIAQTLTASPDPQPNGTIRYERQFSADGRSCVVRAVVRPSIGVYTAFVLGYPDGRFSRCP
jgi:hypothetical protein